MSCLIGDKIRVTIFGQSHSESIGVVIEGLPAGEKLDMEAVESMLDRRRPGKNEFSTARKESDKPIILSGLNGGMTCGAPLTAEFANSDTRSGDYALFRRFPRPSHADFTALVKYGEAFDNRGGGQFSGRLTAPLVFAGAVCAEILKKRGIIIGAHIAEIGSAKDSLFPDVSLNERELTAAAKKDFPVLDDRAGDSMKMEILAAKAEGDSIGGVIECGILGLPVGLGAEGFSGVEGRISQAVFGIPAVKGIEFGRGFELARLRGSEANDPFVYDGDRVVTAKNNSGGIQGGITNGMPLIFRAVVKPTPSIARTQRTVDLEKKENAELEITGRHDPCIAVRCVPCIEAAAAIVMLDMLETKE